MLDDLRCGLIPQGMGSFSPLGKYISMPLEAGRFRGSAGGCVMATRLVLAATKDGMRQ